MKIKLSVVILSYNTSGLLKQCLAAVLASNGFESKELEIIVVDNNSSDGSAEMIEKEYPEIKLIRNKKNLGFSAGNNIGIKNSGGKFLLLLNSDALVEPDSLITILNVMGNNRSIGAATCLLQTADGKIDPASHRGFPTPWNACSYFLGFKIFFYPGVKTLHLKRQSGREQDRDRDLRRETQNMFMDSMWQFYEKHYFNKYPLFLNWLVKIGIKIKKSI